MSTPGPKPQPQPGTGDRRPPSPPAEVQANPEALAEWRRIIKTLKPRAILAHADRAALAMYCISYARWQRAEHHLAEDGDVVITKSGTPMQHPELSIANAAMKNCMRIATEFGFTPSSRARHATQEPPDDDGELTPP